MPAAPATPGSTAGPAPRPAGRWRAIGTVLLAALVAGPLTGWLHSAMLAFERRGLGHFAWYSREFVWMSPLAYTICLFVAMTPLVALAVVRPGLVNLRLVSGWATVVAAFGLLLPWPQVGRPASLVLALGIAVQVARAVARRATWWRANAARVALAEFAVVGIVAAVQPVVRGARERAAMASLPPAASEAPNVLVIILDTVRASSLSLYGFPYPTTPVLEQWAREGTTFDWAMATSPWTLPSHASMFTGRYPSELTANWTVPLDAHTPVLTEAFRARGYQTVAVVANLDYTAYDSGLQRGFIHFEDYLVSWPQLMNSASYPQTALWSELWRARTLAAVVNALRSPDLSIDPKHDEDLRRADRVTGQFLAWQAAHPGRPFFAFLNYFDAHQGYYAPPDFPPIKSPFAKRYHTAIAWTDRNLGTLFQELRSRGVLDHTLVIVASDHGEVFNEHGLTGHANNLYRNVLHVPLVIRMPGTVPAGVRVRREVSLRDLAATIADLGGLGATTFPGVSLRRTWEGDTSGLSPVFATVRKAPNVDASFPTSRGDLAAVFDDQRHYIRNFGGGEELYAYRSDSLETADLGPAEAGATARYRSRIDTLLTQHALPAGKSK